MAKSKSYGGLIFLLVLVVAGAVGGWYYFNKGADKQPDFQTTKVTRGDITQAVTATGDLQPVVTVDVSSQISGQVQEVLVDFNSKVKAGDVLCRIDPSTYQQNLKQAEADLASAKANNQLLRLNAQRTRDLFAKNLVSQQDLDNAEAQLAQSDATLLTRTAAVENARVNLSRCVITAPIDGIVLARLTDKGRTVAASLNAPTLFTLVNDLTKMQINASVAEADIGSIAEGQDVTFTVDAFPNRTFRGVVRQVRNNATTQSSVVSYGTIIDVNNDDLKLKPGMTANVSIIVAQRPNVLRVANSALRVRLPPELQPKAAPAASGEKGAVAMTDEEKRRATMDVIREAGWQMGQPLSPDIVDKAKKIATDKGLSADDITQFATRMQQRMAQGGGGGGGFGGGGGGRRGGGGGGGGGNDRGFNNTVITRTLYKIADPAAKEKKIEAVSARLGISDGFFTEVLGGVNEGDTLVTSVIMPGTASPILQAPGGAQNPFQGGGRGPGMGGMGGGGRGR